MRPTVPRVPLGFFPTPLQELKQLSAHLHGPRIWMKRDDCSGLALGGNKVRKLEYIVADALQQKADVLVTVGAVTSNHARQTAAAAAVLGLECRLVLIGREPPLKQGNYLLDHLLGAPTVCVPNRQADEAIQEVLNECQRRNKRPYFIPAGGHCMWGTLAYLEGFKELVEQAHFPVDAVVTALGTGTTQAGLVLGQESLQHPAEIVGISVGGSQDWCRSEILAVLHQSQDYLGLPHTPGDELRIEEGYIGAGYTRLYPEVRNAIRLLAQCEGIILDPVYTGKAMVGLLDLIRQGRYQPGQHVVFLHTGGVPEVFSCHQYLSE